MAPAVQFPLRKFPFFVPRGAPGLKPPCKRHRLRPRREGRWHTVPARVSAPHRGARLRFASFISRSCFMGLSASFLYPLWPGVSSDCARASTKMISFISTNATGQTCSMTIAPQQPMGVERQRSHLLASHEQTWTPRRQTWTCAWLIENQHQSISYCNINSLAIFSSRSWNAGYFPSKSLFLAIAPMFSVQPTRLPCNSP
jgi:hypothetical protein